MFYRVYTTMKTLEVRASQLAAENVSL